MAPIKDVFMAPCHRCREHAWDGVMLAVPRGFCYNLAAGLENGMEKCFAKGDCHVERQSGR
jgi:hypothetical protein